MARSLRLLALLLCAAVAAEAAAEGAAGAAGAASAATGRGGRKPAVIGTPEAYVEQLRELVSKVMPADTNKLSERWDKATVEEVSSYLPDLKYIGFDNPLKSLKQ